MKCFNCSAPIDESARFCPYCGAAQGFSDELIARGIAGDQAALTELYNKTYDNVYHTVKALIREEDTALDVMQDSYLKAFRNLNTLKEADKFRAWIKRIAHNNAVDQLRRTKPVMFSAMTIDEDDDSEIEFEDTNTANLPDVVIDQQETARLMAQILDTLPDEQRLVISMYYYEGMSVKEIAQELGVTENTVKSRLSYARKKIEVQVRDLEKKGTKLYGLAPMPFLMLILRSWTASAPAVSSAVTAQIFAAVKTASAAAEIGVVSSAAQAISTTAASTAAESGVVSAAAEAVSATAASTAAESGVVSSAAEAISSTAASTSAQSSVMSSGVNAVSSTVASGTAKGGIAGVISAFKASLVAKLVAGVVAVSMVAGVVTPIVVNEFRKANTEVKDVFKDYLGNPYNICVDLSALPDEIEILDAYDDIKERNPATLPEGYGESGFGHSANYVNSLGGNCFVTDSYTWLDLQKYKVDIFFGLCPVGHNKIAYYTTKLEVTPDRLGGLIVADGSYTTGTDENGQPTRFYSIHWQDVPGVTPAKTASAPEETAAEQPIWAELYIDYLHQFREDTIDTSGFSFADLSELDTGAGEIHYDYALVYLDNDDVPELLISPSVGGTIAIGSIVCWVYNDRLCTQYVYDVSACKPNQNDFYGYGISAEGHYETHQYTISGDTLTDTTVGEYIPGTHQPKGDNQQDQNYWNGEPVDSDTYTANYDTFVGRYDKFPFYENRDAVISEIQRMSPSPVSANSQ